MATTIDKQVIDRPEVGVWDGLGLKMEQLSEYFWFVLSFVLFLLLGPFSAPVVVIALVKLGFEENDHREPESIP